MSARPRYHLQPSYGWLNDPNGLVHWRGRWHVFYQHNPDAPRHAQIAWGHASSPDLVTWTEHPVAFRPTPGGPDRGGCWSGVSVVDGDRVAAAYTGVVEHATGSTVCLRYASDPGLDEWSPPRVVASEPDGIDLKEMRDPFVFTWSGRRWAILGAWLESGPGLLLWSCDDLDAWRFERVWFTADDPVVGALATADVWECPQLLEVDGSWVLMVSLWKAGTLDRVVYATGSLVDDGGLPVFAARSAGVADDGGVFYAPQALQAAPGGAPLLFGWAREAEATEPAEPADSVVGCLTLPRRLGLDGDRLVSRTDPAARQLLGDPVEIGVDGRLPAQAHLQVGDTSLTLAGLTEQVEVAAGAEVWLDGEVLEAYPPSGAPSTHRDPGTASWHLTPTPPRRTSRSASNTVVCRRVR